MSINFLKQHKNNRRDVIYNKTIDLKYILDLPAIAF